MDSTSVKKKDKKRKTYNSRDSHVVTHHTTNRPACGLSTAERTGSPVLHTLWSYVLGPTKKLYKKVYDFASVLVNPSQQNGSQVYA